MLLASCGGSGGEADTLDGGAPSGVDAQRPTARACDEGQVKSCVCTSGGSGQSTCRDGRYASCEGCAESVSTGAKSLCVPGVYVIKTVGSYGSTAAGLCGIIGAPDDPVPQEGMATFVLESQLQGGEFSTVGNGCITAPPTPDGGYDIMWRAGITGGVDCSTGVFVGEMRSTYNVTSFCDLGVARRDYFAKGVMRARFDPDKQAFVDGTYELHEPAVLFPLGSQPGGRGTWSASYEADAALPGEPRDCIGIPFPDAMFGDAGT